MTFANSHLLIRITLVSAGLADNFENKALTKSHRAQGNDITWLIMCWNRLTTIIPYEHMRLTHNTKNYNTRDNEHADTFQKIAQLLF